MDSSHPTLSPEISTTSKVVVGLTVSLVATILASFGIALQRKSHLQTLEPPHSQSNLKEFFHRHLWKFGFTVYLCSSITGSIFSIGSLPITLLAPLGAFSLICNAVFARFLLKDPWSLQAGLGTLIILIGAGIVGRNGALPEHDRSLDELLVLYQRTEFILYFSIQNVLLTLALIWNTRNARKLNPEAADITLGRDHPLDLPFQSLSFEGNRTIVGLVYGLISILISTQGILFAKSGIELLTLTLGGQNQFDRPLAWIVVGLLIFTALAQLYYLNRAVEYCDIVLLMPCNYCSYNVSCLLNGLVYYDQWNLLSWWKLSLVLGGTLLLSLGVVVLSLRPHGEDSTLSDDDSEAEIAFLAAESIPPRPASLYLMLNQQLSRHTLHGHVPDEHAPLLTSFLVSSPDSSTSSPPRRSVSLYLPSRNGSLASLNHNKDH